MKQLYSLLSVLLICSPGIGQFQMYVDSSNIYMIPQLNFAKHREKLGQMRITRCDIYSFYDANKPDSSLQKIVWFDTAGHVSKTSIGMHPDAGEDIITFSYDAQHRFTEIQSVSRKECVYKSVYSYFNDTTEIALFRYYHDSDIVHYQEGNKDVVMKAGWDTLYSQTIYNSKKQPIKSLALDKYRAVRSGTVFSYDARGLPLRARNIGRYKKRWPGFSFTYELLDSQFTIMKWDEKRNMNRDMACFYQNNQCFKCTQPFGTYWQFLYTREGLPAEERQHLNSGNVITYKYYYF